MYGGTPRLRSAFPSTPRSTPQIRRPAEPSDGPRSTAVPPLRQAVKQSDSAQPLIPFDLLDAPTQRLMVVGLYGIMTAFRLLDYWKVSDDLDSTWLFLKWVFFDVVALFILPTFRIPWLEWSFSTTVTAFLLHAVMNGFLMFHIPIPVGAWLSALVKIAYDRELSVSERRVKPSDIIHNASLILGKQIIQILPEGSAVLNPDRIPMCLDSTTTFVDLPIRINQTSPILIELLRIDLETWEQEILTINAKQAKQLKRNAEKEQGRLEPSSPRDLRLPVKKPGLYQLKSVIDESKLEVQKRAFDTIIPNCPRARILTDANDKCSGDVSNLHLEVAGLPPFKVKYSKAINNHESSSHFQNIQPDDLVSPLNMQQPSNALVDTREPQLDWAKLVEVSVPINELMGITGTWSYIIEEVQDASGNKISYKAQSEGSSSDRPLKSDQQKDIWVHQRPRMSVTGCDTQHPLKTAIGSKTKLPIDLGHLGSLPQEDLPLHISYSFTPQDGDDTSLTQMKEAVVSDAKSVPMIQDAGFYTIQSVRSSTCSGTVVEPASCLLVHPPKPDIALSTKEVTDECAGRPTGLIVDLELTGTPPFRVRYTVLHDGQLEPRYQDFRGSRGQIQLSPMAAGSYVYEFLQIIDDVYPSVDLRSRGLLLNQNVKPAASASFVGRTPQGTVCLGYRVSAEISLHGEAPWDVEYEVIHRGKRQVRTASSDSDHFHLDTDELKHGGDYSIVLTAVTDSTKCKRDLNEEMKFTVRSEQARAAFGQIDGQKSVLALEGQTVRLPVRLGGVRPWEVKMANLDSSSPSVTTHTFRDPNSVIPVDRPGMYQLMEVRDTCPGLIDPNSKSFKVASFNRPTISVKDDNISKQADSSLQKPPVCQGDEDQLRLAMHGSPPYEIKYSQHQRLPKGAGYIHKERLSAAIGSASVHLDTSKAGDYTYTFNSISDNLYDHDANKFSPIEVHQKVNPLPTARFQSPGKTYGYCTNEASGSEVIPIVLEGVSPFSLEVGITHHGNARPEIVKLKVAENRYDWSLARRELDLGTHSVNIRKVQDNQGCERSIDQDPSSVRIMVSDVPTISPLESQTDYCVGEHISFSLSGLPPFDIFYRFQNHDRKATVTSSSNPTFRRIAEQPGEFTITALSDNASGKCRAEKNLTKTIHPMPTVKVSGGRVSVIDIHEGGEADILFEFTGTPPFEFTYTRSENTNSNKKGSKGKSVVLETRTEKSVGFEKKVRASDAGVYEVTAIKDRYCSFSVEKGGRRSDSGSQKLLKQ